MNHAFALARLAVLASVIALPLGRAVAAPKPTVAILGLELADDGSGIDEKAANAARRLTEALRKRARTQSGPYGVAPGGDRELVDAVLLAGCGAPDKDCLVTIGEGIPADILIYGRLEKRGKGYQVSLTLLDVGKKERVRQLTETIPPGETDPADLDRWGKTLYDKLAGASKGTLIVTANVSTGNVSVDGQAAGNLVEKQARVHGLDVGSHRVRVESDGWIPVEEGVTIEAGETAELAVTLRPSDDDDRGTKRPGGIWRGVFWGSAAVAVGAGAVWGYSFAQYKFLNDPEHGNEDCDDPMILMMDPELESSCNALDRAYIVGPITVGAVAIAGLSYYMGYIRPGPARERAELGRNRPERSALTFAPVIGPDGAGATLRLEW